MHIEAFLDNLKREKQMALNTLEAYRSDIVGFGRYLQDLGKDPLEVTNTDMVGYLLYLKEKQRSPSTINRKLASIRAYYRFLLGEGLVNQDPTLHIKSPRIERKAIDYLTIDEVDRLLAAPDGTVKGKRDRAILELLYATGIRVNELIEADLKDVNLRIGFFTCQGEAGRARIVPIGKPARVALEEYLYAARASFLHKPGSDQEEQALFLNHRGQRLTRQGLWKILKEYGKQASLDKPLTPHMLRNSFAVHMVQNGADLKSLQELLGHEGASATQVYLMASKSRIKDVYDKTHPRA